MRAGLVLRGCVVTLMVALSSPRATLAQTAADKAAAEALFDQGRAAMQEGDFGKACGLLDRSQHIDPGVGTLLYLAECYEKSGRSASAWATFREAADAAQGGRDPSRVRVARDRAARLEPQLSRLVVQVAPETQQLTGLSIERSGSPLPQAVWNVPVPVDPGDYMVRATAPGYEAWTQTVTVVDRAARASVAVPALKKSADAEPAPPGATAPPPPQLAAPGSPSPVEPTTANTGKNQRTIAWVVGGAGVVGVGLGTFFGLRAFSKNGELVDHCPVAGGCSDAEVTSLDGDARSAARAANIAFGIGAAALVGGVVLYLSAPARSPSSQAATLRAAVGPTGFTLGGSFQ